VQAVPASRNLRGCILLEEKIGEVCFDMGVKLTSEGWLDTAVVETPMPIVKHAMASVHAVITKAFASVV
jgi:hypothetical protein